MAIQGPIGKENLDISFRLRSKSQLFDGSANPFQNFNCSNVASASCYGLVFTASSKSELVVVCLKDLERDKATELTAPSRSIPLPAPAKHIAVNCDSSILAVAVKINGVPHLQLYMVQSFLTPNIQKIREARLSTDNSDAVQLCWNPVMNGTLAVCTESGQLNMFTVKDAGLEYHGIDPNFKAKCCCWSPKGKQIVVGFANGKLAQFHPDLKPAKFIDCPPGIMPSTFDTIALQWLSTFQFAAAFLSHQQNSRPILHIINAPKSAPPQYIAYSDVCYSAAEMRPSKIYMYHCIPWNLLVVASANSLDVSFLRVTQAGDLPIWTQEFPNDLFPAELPLTATKDESFPIGFDIDLGCIGKVLREDGNSYPVMPMLHIMSTEGVLCSFYLMNTMQTYVDICSPARPIDPNSISLFKVQEIKKPQVAPVVSQTPPKSEINFTSPISQSTPAVAKGPQKAPSFSIPPTSAAPPAFGISPFTMAGPPSGPQFGTQPNAAVKPFSIPQTVENLSFGQVPQTTQQQQQQPLSQQAPSMTVKPVVQTAPQPLISVPPTFNPQANVGIKPEVKVVPTSSAEDDLIFSTMIKDELSAFDLEMQAVLSKSKSLKLNIGTKEESALMRKQLEELDELKKEATETVESLRSDVQMNRLGLTEMFSMFYEAKAKSEQSNNENSIFLQHKPTKNHGNKRTIDRLINQLSLNEMQLEMATQAIYAQWSNYQEEIKKKKKTRMHNPCMEELYNTLTKNQEIIYRQCEKIAIMKSKLGIKEGQTRVKNMENSTLEKLSDSIISMSLVDQVENENSKLTGKKLKNLRNLLESRETTIIKPQRPERPGLNSEIIREKKLQAMKLMKKPEKRPEVPPAAAIAKPTPKPSFAFNASDAPKAPISSMSKPSEPSSNPPSFSFASTPNNLSFGNQPKPSEPVQKPLAASFAINTPTNPPPFNLNSGSKAPPSFSFGSSSIFTSDKKDEPKPVEPSKLVTSTEKSNNAIQTSASFSIPLSNKVATPVQAKEPPKVTKDESKVEQTATSFTFKLPEKKEETVTATIKTSAPAFGSVTSSSDNSKAFSFSSGGSNLFSGLSSQTTVTPIEAKTTPTPAFSGTPGTKPSLFGSNNTGFSLSFGGSSDTTFALKLGSTPTTVESKAPIIATISEPAKTTSSFSFGSTLGAALASTKSDTATTTTSSTSSFSFGALNLSTTAPSTTTSAPTKSDTFSFVAALPSLASSTPSSTPSTTASLPTFVSSNLTPTTESSIHKVATTEASKTTESTLLGLNICSPDPKPSPAPQTSIFGNSQAFASPKTESSSIFGGNTFGSAFGSASTKTETTQSSIFSGQSSSAATTAPSIFGTQSPAVSTHASVFGQTASSTSIFSTALTDDAKQSVSPTSAPSGPFSLVKPDQSVFGGASVAPLSPPNSPFASSGASTFGNIAPTTGGIFSSSASNVFSSPQSTKAAPSTGGIFAAAAANAPSFGQTASPFGQSSFANPTTASSSVFGSSSTFGSPSSNGNIFAQAAQTQQPQAASAGLFGSQSAFGQSATSGGSVFGGGGAASTATSPFGSSSVFGGNTGATSPFSSSFGSVTQTGFGSPQSGGSMFNQQQQPAFGAAPIFGNKPNIFGQAQTAPSSGQTNSMFEQLGSQQGGNLFGGLGQQPAPQQQQQGQPGFSGSAFSSWR